MEFKVAFLGNKKLIEQYSNNDEKIILITSRGEINLILVPKLEAQGTIYFASSYATFLNEDILRILPINVPNIVYFTANCGLKFESGPIKRVVIDKENPCLALAQELLNDQSLILATIIPKYKIAVVGEAAVGKSAFIRFVRDKPFSEDYIPNAGSEFTTINFQGVKMMIKSSRELKNINDFDVVILMIDASKVVDYNDLNQKIKQVSDLNIPVILCRNKYDLGKVIKFHNSSLSSNCQEVMDVSFKSGYRPNQPLGKIWSLIKSTRPRAEIKKIKAATNEEVKQDFKHFRKVSYEIVSNDLILKTSYETVANDITREANTNYLTLDNMTLKVKHELIKANEVTDF